MEVLIGKHEVAKSLSAADSQSDAYGLIVR